MDDGEVRDVIIVRLCFCFGGLKKWEILNFNPITIDRWMFGLFFSFFVGREGRESGVEIYIWSSTNCLFNDDDDET